MNRHSVFFKLNILFIIAILATIVAAFSMALHMSKNDQRERFFKSRLLMREIRTTSELPHKLIKEFELSIVDNPKRQEILKNAKRRSNSHRLKSNHPSKRRKFLVYKGHRYMHIKLKGVNVLLEDRKTLIERFFTPILVLLGILSLLVMMYVLLRKSLKPLKKLQGDIVKYGEGNLKEYIYSAKKDEISLASNAFYESAQKVEKLRSSRELFIRNIFHELNTPVTKGKILAEIVEEPKTKNMLNSIITRLSTLLKELAKVEKITSENYSISIKPIRIIELIDEASDLLYLDKNIKTNVTNEMIDADFSSMSIVFKNLIDNAHKYAKNLEIIYKKDTLFFISEAEPLAEDLSSYIKAFSTKSKKGFGLGLYIVNEIIHKHKMIFTYKHENKKNKFIIKI